MWDDREQIGLDLFAAVNVEPQARSGITPRSPTSKLWQVRVAVAPHLLDYASLGFGREVTLNGRVQLQLKMVDLSLRPVHSDLNAIVVVPEERDRDDPRSRNPRRALGRRSPQPIF